MPEYLGGKARKYSRTNPQINRGVQGTYSLEFQAIKGSVIAWPNRQKLFTLSAWIVKDIGNRSYAQDLSDARQIFDMWRSWVLSYKSVYGTRNAFKELKKDWKVLRVMISLQQRLIIEQIFSDIGSPYNSLVTGFGAII